LHGQEIFQVAKTWRGKCTGGRKRELQKSGTLSVQWLQLKSAESRNNRRK